MIRITAVIETVTLIEDKVHNFQIKKEMITEMNTEMKTETKMVIIIIM